MLCAGIMSLPGIGRARRIVGGDDVIPQDAFACDVFRRVLTEPVPVDIEPDHPLVPQIADV